MRNLPESIIRASFHLSVKAIEHFYQMTLFKEKADNLKKMEDGTLGRDIAECLEKNKLNLVPGYESHDLKHVLLDYKMTPIDEIRMQAFMIGNGNISIPSIAIFLFGFLLLPYKWKQFFQDFRLGLQSTPIKSWTIEKYADKKTLTLRSEVIGTRKLEVNFSYIITKTAPILALVLGAFGMMFCLPFLFSNVTQDLIGAGLSFIGGAIIFSGGLISYTITHNKGKTNSYLHESLS